MLGGLIMQAHYTFCLIILQIYPALQAQQESTERGRDRVAKKADELKKGKQQQPLLFIQKRPTFQEATQFNFP